MELQDRKVGLGELQVKANYLPQRMVLVGAYGSEGYRDEEVLLGSSKNLRKKKMMVEIKIGDCVDRLKDLEDSSVDSIIATLPTDLSL